MKETESSSKDMPCEHVLAAGDGCSHHVSPPHITFAPYQGNFRTSFTSLKRAESNRSRFRVSQSSRNREEKFDRFATYFADAATPFETSSTEQPSVAAMLRYRRRGMSASTAGDGATG